MSFSREIKDFVQAFSAGVKLWKDNEYNAARAKYYNAQANKLENPDPMDQKLKELQLREKEARIGLIGAQTSAVGRRGAGSGSGISEEGWRSLLGGGSGPPAGFGSPDEEGDSASMGDDDDDVLQFSGGGAVPMMDEGPTDPADESAGAYWTRERARAERAGETTSAPLSEAIGGGLKFLQRAFGLDGEAAALPGTDPKQQEGARALVSGAGAPSDEEMRAVRKAIDPNSEIGDALANATALQRVYDFHKAQGNQEGASKAAGQFLQYYRNQSAKLGALAQVALQNNDINGAVNAAIGGFNQIPDGNVAKRAGDKIMIANAKTGDPVEEIPITPRVLTQASRALADGSSFYTFMAQAAGAGTGPASPPTSPSPQGAIPPATPAETPASSPDAPADTGASPDDDLEGALAEEAAANQFTPPAQAPAAAARQTQGALPGVAGRGRPAAYDDLSPPPLPRQIDEARAKAMGANKNDLAAIKRINDQARNNYNIEYRRYQDELRRRDTIASADRREEFSQEQQNQRMLASSALEDKRSANQTTRNELSQMRIEQFRNSRPRDFDTSDRGRVKEIEEFVYEAAAKGSDGKVTEAVLKKEFGVRGVQRLRDATIDLYRYNSSMPLDTAASVAHYLAAPITAETTSAFDVDNAPNAAPYTVTKLQGVPGIENGSPRVVISANNREFPDIVLPASTMQQLDILRGQRTQAFYASEAEKAKKGLADTTRQNTLVDARRKVGIELDGRQAERSRNWRMRGERITDQLGGR
jgi:hypothetical protein